MTSMEFRDDSRLTSEAGMIMYSRRGPDGVQDLSAARSVRLGPHETTTANLDTHFNESLTLVRHLNDPFTFHLISESLAMAAYATNDLTVDVRPSVMLAVGGEGFQTVPLSLTPVLVEWDWSRESTAPARLS